MSDVTWSRVSHCCPLGTRCTCLCPLANGACGRALRKVQRQEGRNPWKRTSSFCVRPSKSNLSLKGGFPFSVAKDTSKPAFLKAVYGPAASVKPVNHKPASVGTSPSPEGLVSRGVHFHSPTCWLVAIISLHDADLPRRCHCVVSPSRLEPMRCVCGQQQSVLSANVRCR